MSVSWTPFLACFRPLDALELIVLVDLMDQNQKTTGRSKGWLKTSESWPMIYAARLREGKGATEQQLIAPADLHSERRRRW